MGKTRADAAGTEKRDPGPEFREKRSVFSARQAHDETGGLQPFCHGIPGCRKAQVRQSGKDLFLRDEDQKLSGVYINLGSYICDGQWHRKEVPLTAANIVPFKYWKNASGIRKLRFDPFENQGTMEIRSMEFLRDDKRAEAAESAQKAILQLKPEELLEKSADGVTFTGISGEYRLSSDNPADGKYCLEQGGDSNEESVARSRTVFPVKPDTRYIIRFYSRNTVPVGHVLFRFIQSRKSDVLAVTNYLDSGWTQLACNLENGPRVKKSSGPSRTPAASRSLFMSKTTESAKPGGINSSWRKFRKPSRS